MVMYSLTPMTADEIRKNLDQTTLNNLEVELERRIGPARQDLAKGRPFQIAKEAWEYALADSLEWKGGEWVGHGNNPEDVRVNDQIHYDVKGLSGKWNSNSSEGSIKQSLKTEFRIDENFQTKNSSALWNSTVEPWIEKVFSKSNYYITVFWRHSKDLNIRLVMFRIDNTRVPQYDSTKCVFNKSQSTMDIHNIVDPDQAKIYVLKSKKRMELRIKGKFFNNPKWFVPVYSFENNLDNKLKGVIV
jgi:hypothetical protein